MRIANLAATGVAMIPAHAFGHSGHGTSTGWLHWLIEPQHVFLAGGMVVLAGALLTARWLVHRFALSQ